MIILIHNIKEWVRNPEPIYKIKCEHCGKVQDKANGWDYQKCDNCSEYLYDVR